MAGDGDGVPVNPHRRATLGGAADGRGIPDIQRTVALAGGMVWKTDVKNGEKAAASAAAF